MTCTGPGSDSKKAAAGSVAVAAGRMAVLMTPQSASLQLAMLDGIAGALGAGLSTLSTKPLTVLLAPVLVTTPEPVEFVIVPVLIPTNAPTVLLAPVLVTAPDRLARNYVHQMVLLEEWTRAGCTTEFLERPMSDDPHDHLLLQIRAWFKSG